VKKVVEDSTMGVRKLLHGDTVHGIESVNPDRAGEPLSYYYRGGSVSDVVELLKQRGTDQRLGVLGLGSGSMAPYADAQHRMTFYEIDPDVEAIARKHFSFLSRCGGNCDVVIGDGRLQLEREPDASFDLLLLDVFSSDSVPAHMLSREAIRVYVSKMKPDGVLLFHVSNRYLDLERLAAGLLHDAGLTAISRFDEAGDARSMGKSNSQHVAGARTREVLATLETRPEWHPVARSGGFDPWTDDYSNLMGLIRWH
jgi:SAM-dependent methyltransferase